MSLHHHVQVIECEQNLTIGYSHSTRGRDDDPAASAPPKNATPRPLRGDGAGDH